MPDPVPEPLAPDQPADQVSRPTDRGWPDPYRPAGSIATAAGPLEVWNSTAVSDPLWDDFLRGTPCGQFQQSSLWAEYKAGEGWNHHRVVLTGAGGIVGGFQLLWKTSRFVRLGYVSKGPVGPRDLPEIDRHLAVLLARAAADLRLIALIAQQPDEDAQGPGAYEDVGFIRSNPMGVIEATYVVDVRDGVEAMNRRMHRNLRRDIRKGRQRGVVVREGTKADIPRFFELMASICRRLHTAPNPSSVEATEALWRVFARSNSIRMTLAECAGVPVAAMLSLQFGKAVTSWKKGWDGTHDDWHPNKVLQGESLEWAHARGYDCSDFCSFSVGTARRILGKQPLPPRSLSGRDEYHLQFGGTSKLLPPSLVLISNRILRWLFRQTYVRRERRRGPD